jgi:hypothetical protein
MRAAKRGTKNRKGGKAKRAAADEARTIPSPVIILSLKRERSPCHSLAKNRPARNERPDTASRNIRCFQSAGKERSMENRNAAYNRRRR